MGFGSLLHIDIDTTPSLLNYYLLDHYEPSSSRLSMENMVITITKDTLHEMLGLPNTGEDFLSLSSCDKDNEVHQEWKGQYDKKGFNGEEYLKRIKNTKQDNLMFRLNILTLFINTFAESTLSGPNQINVVNKLVLVKEFSKIDWCKYILDCLVRRKQMWRKDDKTCYYSGPILVLTLVYVHKMKFAGMKIVKRLAFVRNVTGSLLEKIEKMEMSVGGFGRQLPENFEDIGDDDGMVDEDDILDGMMRDYGDEEAYVAVIKHSYGVILSKKKNIERALKHGIEKFPDSLSLKEWCGKNKKLFK
ncbi:unnamed protein product [Lactuca saligna]|uniref:Uncharacterized protein n=1 Tax=Lactuca saligna TaxID=75948 RepID=A0AA36A4I6_LACSI|nr:unnamed protein product [Lactuca saligna]